MIYHAVKQSRCFFSMETRRNVTRTRMAISVHHARLAVCHDQTRLQFVFFFPHISDDEPP